MTHLETPGLTVPTARAPQGSGMGLDDSVYQRLLRERIIFLGSVVEDTNANAICAQMLLLDAEDPGRDIWLYINSPGGSVSAGLAIYDTMQFVKSDVATVAMGLAASMGQFLLSAGEKGKRYATPQRADHDAPAVRRSRRHGLGHQDPGRADAVHEEAPGPADRPAHRPGAATPSRPTPTATAGSTPRAPRTTDSSTTSSPAPARSPAAASAPEPTERSRGHPVDQRSQLQTPAPQARYILPNFIERTAQGFREYNPYAKLFEERIIFLGVQIDDASADDVMAQLLCLESMDPDRDIQIYINSPGGSYTAMTAIYDTMRFVKPDIHTVCLGQAASAAAVLLAAGSPGKRFALPHSRILIHQPYTEGGGQGSDIEIQANEILRMRAEMEGILALHTGRDVAQIQKDIERDKILTADDALEYGLVDQVIPSRKASAAV